MEQIEYLPIADSFYVIAKGNTLGKLIKRYDKQYYFYSPEYFPISLDQMKQIVAKMEELNGT